MLKIVKQNLINQKRFEIENLNFFFVGGIANKSVFLFCRAGSNNGKSGFFIFVGRVLIMKIHCIYFNKNNCDRFL